MTHDPLCNHDIYLTYRCDCLTEGGACIYCDCELIREAKHVALTQAREAVQETHYEYCESAENHVAFDMATTAIDALLAETQEPAHNPKGNA